MADDAQAAVEAVKQFEADEELAKRMQVEDEFDRATNTLDAQKSEKEAKKLQGIELSKK
eukprot:NODE_7812_length_383_cov_659.452096_g6112_i0.p1 GENE.NODE_7812_length_383_cov_659.452096_g6112_i0~~NODE_7812_length_383_cov_659.452096_g6112_i0.p1  ORF type:complete len:59 (-),score=9.97 NODE_7812_length_383_cov_659.452096_g6112_i0:181-357(-)